MTLPTVLIADDDRSIRTVLTQALGRSGYQVRSTGNAATLWRWVEDGEGDLVITDVVMPSMDGPTMVRHVKQLKPDLRVIFMSGYAEEAFRRNDQSSEDIHFLPKPFGLKQLAAKVKAVLSAA